MTAGLFVRAPAALCASMSRGRPVVASGNRELSSIGRPRYPAASSDDVVQVCAAVSLVRTMSNLVLVQV